MGSPRKMRRREEVQERLMQPPVQKEVTPDPVPSASPSRPDNPEVEPMDEELTDLTTNSHANDSEPSSSSALSDKDSGFKSSGSDSDCSESPIPENEYIVEEILDYNKEQNVYLIKWKDWDPSWNSWEPFENLENSPDLLYTFYLERKAAFREIMSRQEQEGQETYMLVNGRKRRKIPKIRLKIPPDPRPIAQRAEDFYNQTRSPTDAEKQEWEQLWKDNFQRVRIQNKKDSVRWQKSRIDKMIEDCEYQLFEENEISELRKQVYLMELDAKRVEAEGELKDWEKEMNSISLNLPLIKVENNVDWAGRPEGFSYINDYLPGPDVVIPNEPVLSCTCENCGHDKNKKKCCESHNLSSFSSFYAYNSYKRLRTNIKIGTPIFECNSACSCDDNCTNRVVQDGRKSTKDLRLVIFRTDNNCGWGVKTLRPIKAGTFVSLYIGEIITTEEADRRGPDSDGTTYLFDLDYNEGDMNPYTIDAKKYGNISHFINHSCDPNLAVFNVWVNCLDLNLPKLALFAVRDIEKGQELSFDYLNEAKDKDKNDEVESPSRVKIPCMCKAKNCRKFLFR